MSYFSDLPKSSCGSSRANLLVIEDGPVQVATLLTLSLHSQACLQDSYESPVKPVMHKKRESFRYVYLICGGLIALLLAHAYWHPCRRVIEELSASESTNDSDDEQFGKTIDATSKSDFRNDEDKLMYVC